MSPSVRRALRPLLGLILVTTGLLANLPLVLLAWAWSAGAHVRAAPEVAALLAFASVALDIAHRGGRGPRPFAVHTQVPQWWGHRYGPWWAAARFGLRLGLGPATILTTWTWWAGAMVAGSWGPRWAFLATAAFVCVRSIVSISATFGPRDGLAMAARSRRLDSVERPTRLVAQGVVLLASAAVGIVGLTT